MQMYKRGGLLMGLEAIKLEAITSEITDSVIELKSRHKKIPKPDNDNW